MASLQSSCTALSATPNHRISPCLSAKPSQLLMNARRSHRFKVSCDGEKASKEGRVDRRNMLLGMGGLYGAANLISDPKAAFADPLQPPEFAECGIAHVNGVPLPVNCCPPIGDEIIDYQLPPITTMKLRTAAHRMSPKNLALYELGIQRMRDLDISNPEDPRGFTQQANIHCAYCNGAHDQAGHPDLDIQIHFNWLFFPFHRWYLYFYERILAELAEDDTLALPFWNWDHPMGMTFPEIFDNKDSPLFNENRNQAHRYPQIITLNRSDDDGASDPQKISNNFAQMYNEMIRNVRTIGDFMGLPYRAEDPPTGPGFGGTSELGSHTGGHAWVGDPRNVQYKEDMGNFYSAGRDTVFYCHHANVDRMWNVWKTLPNDIPKEIDDPDYLNASFLFYDEKQRLVRVKVADCLDNTKMGYYYENIDLPWLNSRPARRAVPAKIEDLSKKAETAAKLFPVTLNHTVRVQISKSAIGKADELLVLENIITDADRYIKFDIYINDEDDKPTDIDRAEYAGSFAQLPHKGTIATDKNTTTLSFYLKELYEDINIADDDTVVVTIVPHENGQHCTIGGIKITPAAPTTSA